VAEVQGCLIQLNAISRVFLHPLGMIDIASLESHGLFDRNVPRYTSYPTATHFSNSLRSDLMPEWLQKLNPDERISLYLHVPFCRRVCWFCACRTQGLGDDGRLERYLKALQLEVELVARHLPDRIEVDRVHFGGGTPTLLTPDQLDLILSTIHTHFDLHHDREFSVEIDPNEIDEERLDVLIQHGLNRASIGVQDFDPAIQKAIGREQSYEVTRDCVAMLRSAGVKSLNADILYGLPHQTEARLSQSIEQLIGLNPDRVALYGYAHVPWMAKRQVIIPDDALPSTQQRFRLSELAQTLFQSHGYQSIGIDHFAKPGDGSAIAANTGHLRRNFQGYTDDVSPTLIGLGASSISKFPFGYLQNDPKTGGYYERIEKNEFAVTRGHVFRMDDSLRARAVEMLLCDFKIDFEALGSAFPDESVETLVTLGRHAAEHFDGFVEMRDHVLSIATEGRPLTRIIAQWFDAYEVANTAHSSAI
jgi:oxygen-independent coproporphyrinogen-3 oxidase